jgi:hypothetical protein
MFDYLYYSKKIGNCFRIKKILSNTYNFYIFKQVHGGQLNTQSTLLPPRHVLLCDGHSQCGTRCTMRMVGIKDIVYCHTKGCACKRYRPDPGLLCCALAPTNMGPDMQLTGLKKKCGGLDPLGSGVFRSAVRPYPLLRCLSLSLPGQLLFLSSSSCPPFLSPSA